MHICKAKCQTADGASSYLYNIRLVELATAHSVLKVIQLFTAFIVLSLLHLFVFARHHANVQLAA